MDDKTVLYADTLQEICNMSSGNAAAALSKLLNRKVTFSVPEAYLTNEKPDVDALIEETGSTVIFEVEFFSDEKENGCIYLFFNYASVMELIRSMTGVDANDEEMQESVVTEVGNIAASCIVTPVANLLGKKVMISTPRMAVEAPAAAVESAIAGQFEKTGASLFAHTVMYVEGSLISMRLFLFPHFDLVKEIWKKTGLST